MKCIDGTLFLLRCSPTSPLRQSHGQVVNIDALERLVIVLFSDQDGLLFIKSSQRFRIGDMKSH